MQNGTITRIEVQNIPDRGPEDEFIDQNVDYWIWVANSPAAAWPGTFYLVEATALSEVNTTVIALSNSDRLALVTGE